MSILNQKIVYNGELWEIVFLADDTCGIAVAGDNDPYILTVNRDEIEELLTKQDMNKTNKLRIFRTVIIDGVDRGLVQIRETSPTIKNQKKFSKTNRKNVFEILSEGFAHPEQILLTPSDMVIWYMACELTIERELKKNYYPAGLAKRLTRFAKKNLQKLIGKDTWETFNPDLALIVE